LGSSFSLRDIFLEGINWSLRERKYLPWEGRGRNRFLWQKRRMKMENKNIPKGGKISPLGGEREKSIS